MIKELLSTVAQKRQKKMILLVFCLVLPFRSLFCQEKYNVLFIAIDDLNDYVSLLEDHPGIKTPNLDKFAKEAVTFTRAYTAAPVCNPSRAAVLTGLSPAITGLYDNPDHFQNSEEAMAARLIPEHFKKNGYRTMWSGKLFHTGREQYFSRPGKQRMEEMWDDSRGHDGGYGPMPVKSNIPDSIRHPPLFDYGPWKGPDKDFPDVVNTDITIDRLNQHYESPFFMTLGIYRPHNPWTAPKRFFDMYPLDEVKVPEVFEDDLDDIPEIGKAWAGKPVSLDTLKSIDQWKPVVRSYLASVSFMDYNLGRVLEALENSEYGDNTIVVLWADHGFHLGEKEHFAKYALWEKTTHTLLMAKIPGGPEDEGRDQPVNLLDIYPTLIDYCDLPETPQTLSGRSLRPLIEDPGTWSEKPSITYYINGSIGMRSEKWRYIRYYDGTEELYDSREDPDEWKNLAGKAEYKNVIEDFQKQIPSKIKPDVGPIKKQVR